MCAGISGGPRGLVCAGISGGPRGLVYAGSQEDNDDRQEEACGLHIVQHLL